jgi:hypothetical protein
MNYQKSKMLLGWTVFLISLLVYGLTIEPTLSLWDCGEFLVSAYKLEICHAPGAPLFMLLGRVFSLLSFGDVERVALLINWVSALSSAGTVMLLFWISAWLMEKFTLENRAAVLLASAVGALTFAFTDSFWFSAVEAEVYALSSLFVALVLWAATRWEREADQPTANRWILLIFFFTGLSIGVHLLNLLVLPTVALIIYFKKYRSSLKGIFFVLAGSGLFIIILMKVFIPGIFSLAGPVELFAVNQLGFPVNSGFYVYVILLAAALSAGLFYSHKKQKAGLNLGLLCVLFLLVGYTSYFVPFIRSAANPPVDQGNPETTFELINYLNRENYGSRPILYGATYGSVARSYTDRTSYEYDGEQYYPIKLNPDIKYEPGTTSFFPRMNSREEQHLKRCAKWVDLKGKKVHIRTKSGEAKQTTIPTFMENLQYFWRYQFGHMYWRYLMWNFVGRQNDIQGFGGVENGNWQSGISWIDQARLGDLSTYPKELQQNKAHNSYFFLPLLLGLVGLFFHYRKDKQTFLEMILLFGIMSIGLVVYLNEIPITPRERDYVYVGSFFVFSLWVGVGAFAFFVFLKERFRTNSALVIVGLITMAAGPGILLQQNYDDHDRSGRYTARDLARNYLECCEPNAILFTHADNDTYPLWYCQEVEGIRQDVRIVVMPYLNAGWYMKQIHHKIYENEGVKLTIPVEKYSKGEVDYLPIVPRISKEQAIDKVLDFVANDSSQTKVRLQSGERVNFIPVSEMYLPVGDNRIPIGTDKKYLMRNELAFWDILSSNAAERPICFTSISDAIEYGLQDHLSYDGLVYRLVPDYQKSNSVIDTGIVDTDRLYTNLMKKCNWENMEDADVYFDWHHRRLFASAQIRLSFYRLAQALVNENRNEEALEVINKSREIISFRNWPLDYYSVLMNDLFFKMGEKQVGESDLKQLSENLEEWINYYLNMENPKRVGLSRDLQLKLYLYQNLVSRAEENQLASSHDMKDKLAGYLALFDN